MSTKSPLICGLIALALLMRSQLPHDLRPIAFSALPPPSTVVCFPPGRSRLSTMTNRDGSAAQWPATASAAAVASLPFWFDMRTYWLSLGEAREPFH